MMHDDDQSPFQQWATTQSLRIEMPKLKCVRCEQEADGSFQLKGGDEVWCQYCVREALVRMTAELRK